MRLIDADALKKYIDVQKGRPFIGCTIGEALKIMTDEQPTIEERKTGKWNWVGFNIECSECGCMPYFDSTEPLYHFCPNCGARMEGDT